MVAVNLTPWLLSWKLPWLIRFNNILPSKIALTGNKVSHLCWDNLDVNEERPSGAGTTHSTHDTVANSPGFQKLQDDYVPEQNISVNKTKTKQKIGQ